AVMTPCEPASISAVPTASASATGTRMDASSHCAARRFPSFPAAAIARSLYDGVAKRGKSRYAGAMRVRRDGGSFIGLAHRGASGTFPENTPRAFAAALELGVDGIELDCQLSADGELVVIH